ncbi:toprim domain-containing protein, partial [Pseudomonas aeruginosa]|uniref:toprim domain-containing protein n=2 Tax=Pseudomonas aeruginosa TaxID=287 RepID=UPI00053DFC33
MRLYLCEKPSQDKDIAKVLGTTRRGKGYLNVPERTVTWCIGHLLEAALPEAYGEQYKQWLLEQLPIIPSQWKLEVKPKAAKQLRVIQRLLDEADSMVIATDAGYEGEMTTHKIRGGDPAPLLLRP